MSKFYTQTVHSDILIHWTGKDFDLEVKEDFYSNEAIKHPSIIKDDVLIDKYLMRLKNILLYGFWVVDVEDTIGINGNNFSITKFPMVCFTELKLSESRKHAFRYGRLGIGLKRLFVVGRGGQPVQYLHHQGKSHFFPPYVDESELIQSKYAFFKRMNSTSDLNYDMFSESEWRIVYDQSFRLEEHYVNPRGNLTVEFKKYSYGEFLKFDEFEKYCEEAIKDDRLKYLLPLNGWLAMVIYPSPQVKNRAAELKINELIDNIKTKNHRTINPAYEQKMMPVELDLDLCDHF